MDGEACPSVYAHLDGQIGDGFCGLGYSFGLVKICPRGLGEIPGQMTIDESIVNQIHLVFRCVPPGGLGRGLKQIRFKHERPINWGGSSGQPHLKLTISQSVEEHYYSRMLSFAYGLYFPLKCPV